MGHFPTKKDKDFPHLPLPLGSGNPPADRTDQNKGVLQVAPRCPVILTQLVGAFTQADSAPEADPLTEAGSGTAFAVPAGKQCHSPPFIHPMY